MSEVYAATESARAAVEAAVLPRISAILRAQGRRIATAAANAGSGYSASFEAQIEASDPTPAVRLLEAVWFRAVPLFAETAYDALAPKRHWSFDWLEVVKAFLAAEGAEMVVGITETTREMVAAIIAEGVAEGENPRQIARRLRAEWGELSRVRAERIARTESIAASNHGSFTGARAAAEQFGLSLEKVWISTPDGRTRESHRATNGQRRPLDEPFDVGGFPARYPADPMLPAAQRIQCRCAVAFEPTEAKSRPEIEERRRDVRASYPELKRQHGREAALDRLAEKHLVSRWTVERDWETRPR